jgi:hypothetical protein
MAVWKGKVAGVEVRILDVDHLPPHCHAYVKRRDVRIDLRTLEILNPPPHALPPGLRRGLARVQEELLSAWERVRVIRPGRAPGDPASEGDE